MGSYGAATGTPGQVTLLTPLDDATVATNRPTLTWSQPSPSASWYHLWLSCNGDTYMELWQTNRSWTSATDLPSGAYSWWVQGWNTNGLGPWSADNSFTVPDNTPGPVTLLTPANGETVATMRPTLTWSQPSPSADWYQLWLSRNGATYTNVWVQTLSWTSATDLPSGTYLWWIQGWNQYGLGAWSAGNSFNVGIRLLTPANGEIVATNRPTFTWSEPSPSVDRYHLWLEQNGVKYAEDDQIPINQWTPVTDLPSGAYSWWIGWDQNGATHWAGPSSFMVPSYIGGRQSELEDAFKKGGVVFFKTSTNISLTKQLSLSAANLTIDALSNSVTITAGGSNISLIYIPSGRSLELRHLTLSGGQNAAAGAIYNLGSMVLSNCIISGNKGAGTNGSAGAAGQDDYSEGTDGGNGANGSASYGGAINNGGWASLRYCTLTNNSATGGSGGNGGRGGNAGTTNSHGFNGGNGGNGGNGAGAYGGAIFNSGTLLLTNCTVAANTATAGNGGDGGDGGIGAIPGVKGTGGAGAEAEGGGIYNVGQLQTANCTFMNNTAQAGKAAAGGASPDSGNGVNGANGGFAAGGGICNQNLSVVYNCTFFVNKASGGDGGNGGSSDWIGGDGGAGGYGMGGSFYNSSVAYAYVTNVTFYGGGSYGGAGGASGSGVSPGKAGNGGWALGANVLNNSGGTFVLKNSILTTNLSGYNAYGTFIEGYNLSSDSTPSSDGSTGTKLNADAKLDGLGNNWGPTWTMALKSGSPAIDTGDPYVCLATDQRGAPRPSGSGGDIGAFEYGLRPVILSQTLTNYATVGTTSGVITVKCVADPPSESKWWWWNSSSKTWDDQNVDAINYDVFVSWELSTTGTNGIQRGDAGIWLWTISNDYGWAQTSNYLFIGKAPIIAEGGQPKNYTNVVGNSAVFSVTATADIRDYPLYYQWQFHGTNLLNHGHYSGVTSSRLSISLISNDCVGSYRLVVTNKFGSVTSSNAFLAIGVEPYNLRVQPSSQTNAAGGSASFSVTASGTDPLRYQWRFNNMDLPNNSHYNGATNSSLTISNLTSADTGTNYIVVVGNDYGTATSTAASLTITNPMSVTIRGLVMTTENESLSGVKVELKQAETNYVTYTIDDGSYLLTGVSTGWWSVTASKDCWRLPPRSSMLLTITTNWNFLAERYHYAIVGRITKQNDTNGVSSVSLTAISGGEQVVINDDSAGNFVLTNLCPGIWSVVPSRFGYAFKPASTNVTVGTNDIVLVNFTAWPIYYIEGQVLTEYDNGLGGVTVHVTNSLIHTNLLTDSLGSYQITNLAAGNYLLSLGNPYQDPAMGFTPRVTNITVGQNMVVNFYAKPVLTRTNGGQMRFTAVETRNQTYSIWAATNLPAGTNWEKICTTNASTNGLIQFLDSQATNLPKRFYRTSKP